MEHADKVFDEMSQPSVADQNKPDFKELDLGSLSSVSFSKDPSRRRSNRSHSGELNNVGAVTTPEKTRSVSSSGSGDMNRKMGHRRSYSTGAPLIYSGSGTGFINGSNSTSTSTNSTTTSGGSGGGGGGNISSVNSPNTNMLYPSGNICPSGKVLKSNMNLRNSTTKTEKLGLGMGTGNYGHGSIIKGGGKSGDPNGEIGVIVKKAMASHDVEEVKNAGNELYKRGNFTEALSLYDRAIMISPDNAACRSNRAAALTVLGRLGEAVRECEEAVRLNPGYQRAHQRSASLYLRLGQVERAYHHLSHGQQNDLTELQKVQTLEKHINRCSDARKIGDWKGALRECEAAMLTGAVSSPQIFACKAEAFLKLHRLEDADSVLAELPKIEPFPVSCSQVKFFGVNCEAYVLYVRAHADMAFGRAVCWSKLGLWEKSIEDCNLALNFHPNYTKAIMRRAVSNAKLERWGEAVRDYEILRKELPGDNEVAESLLRAQEALRLTRGEPSGVNRARATANSCEHQPSSIKSRNH
nr:inactive TPR repeat-containing thioredoxin TTL3-like [Tanacetum cinerariifolium]